MEEKDWDWWKEFRSKDDESISGKEVKMIATLHAYYFKHKFFMPCKCNPRNRLAKVQGWIKDLNKLWLSAKPKIR